MEGARSERLLLGAFRSPSTFLGSADLVDFFFASMTTVVESMFSSGMASEEDTLEEALVVRVERVERVAFLTGMVCDLK